MNKSLKQVFEEHNGKVSDKWSLYLDEWNQLFAPYQDQQIRLLEIGIQNGGSLEVWGKYFSKAEKIVGCDIDPKCEQLRYDDTRITVIVSDANSDDGESKIVQQAPTFDIVIDDGSHKSSDIVRSFARYFPHLNDSGFYVVEDLHSSYWEDFEGGLHNPLSAMAFFKRLADIVNYEHWRNNKPRGILLTKFVMEFGIEFDEFDLTRIHSIEFINSLCIIRKLSSDKNVLGKRIVVGTDGRVTIGWEKLNGTAIQDMAMDIKDDVNLDVFELIAHTNSLTQIISDREQSIQNLIKLVDEKEQAVLAFQAQLAEKEQAMQGLSSQVARKEQIVQILNTQVMEKEKTLQIFNSKLLEIYGSRAWRLIRLLWRLRERLVPHGSTRERIARFFYRPIRHWRVYGFKALVRRSFQEFAEDHTTSAATTSAPPVAPSAVANPAVQVLDPSPISLDEAIYQRFPSTLPLPAFSVPFFERRLNVITDSINAGSLFGGVATAMIFSALLAERWECDLRIITRTEQANKKNFRDILDLNGIPWNKNVEFLLANPNDPKAEVPVGDGDIFLTTSWWTTKSVLGMFGADRIIYLLQEDERAFYPYSDDYFRCNELLKNPYIRFVINTKMLYEHLVADGFENIQKNGLWFEPSWPKSLFFPDTRRQDKKKNFFFYARPKNLRNLFYLGLETIDMAVQKGTLDLDEWDFHFMGKDIPKVRISNSYIPNFYQNVSWSEYASVVRKIDLGLSLIYTSHPSYPPLDLASSGAVVVTNRFGRKQNLDAYSRNILCRDLDVDSLVQGLAEGVILANNHDLRFKNFQKNGILRNWKTSFEDILAQLER